MGLADVPTKLPLARWAYLMGLNPVHFEGLAIPEYTLKCASSWAQYEWQSNDRASREEVARAIRSAEDDLERYLGYNVLPDWTVDEWVNAPVPNDPGRLFVSMDLANLRTRTFETGKSRVISGGIRSVDVLEAGAAIAWSGTDSIGYDTTGTVTVLGVPDGVQACEIRLFVPGYTDPQWELRPINVTLAAGVATITFRREIAVDPTLARALTWQALDATVDANFLAEVDVVRVYNDPQLQVQFIWQPPDQCSCSGGCAVCAYGQQAGCIIPAEARKRQIAAHPGTWDATTETFTSVQWASGRMPDMARMYYYSGVRDMSLGCPTVEMNQFWAQTVAIMAAARLDRDPCECRADYFARWKMDLAMRAAQNVVSYRATDAQLTNPFGTRRGEVFAWQRVRNLAEDQGVNYR